MKRNYQGLLLNIPRPCCLSFFHKSLKHLPIALRMGSFPFFSLFFVCFVIEEFIEIIISLLATNYSHSVYSFNNCCKCQTSIRLCVWNHGHRPDEESYDWFIVEEFLLISFCCVLFLKFLHIVKHKKKKKKKRFASSTINPFIRLQPAKINSN